MSSSGEFSSFYQEVKTIEREDSKYTSDQQINRLLRPGSTYANLNPFEVLLVDPDEPVERIKKQYKKLSILLHPDKNPDNQERAQQAFDALTKAYKVLENEESRQKALEVVEEAKHKLKKEIQEKRKRLKAASRKDDVRVDEDDPAKYKESLRVIIMKLFAEQERKRRMMLDRVQEEKKRKHEEEAEAQQARELEREWQKNFEESRQNRVNSWHDFNKKTKFKRKDIRPPKHKAEASSSSSSSKTGRN